MFFENKKKNYNKSISLDRLTRSGNNCEAMHIVISASNKDATSYHYRRWEYVTWEFRGGKLFDHWGRWIAVPSSLSLCFCSDSYQMDTPRTAANASQSEMQEQVVVILGIKIQPQGTTRVSHTYRSGMMGQKPIQYVRRCMRKMWLDPECHTPSE